MKTVPSILKAPESSSSPKVVVAAVKTPWKALEVSVLINPFARVCLTNGKVKPLQSGRQHGVRQVDVETRQNPMLNAKRSVSAILLTDMTAIVNQKNPRPQMTSATGKVPA